MGFGLLLGVVILMNSNVAIEKSVTSWHQLSVHMCNPLERETIMMQTLFSNYRFSRRLHIWHIQKKGEYFPASDFNFTLVAEVICSAPSSSGYLIDLTPGSYSNTRYIPPKNSEFVGHATSLQKVQIKRQISSSALIVILHTK